MPHRLMRQEYQCQGTSLNSCFINKALQEGAYINSSGKRTNWSSKGCKKTRSLRKSFKDFFMKIFQKNLLLAKGIAIGICLAAIVVQKDHINWRFAATKQQQPQQHHSPSDFMYLANDLHSLVVSGDVVIPSNPFTHHIEGSQKEFWCGEFTRAIKLHIRYAGQAGDVWFVGNGDFWFFVNQKIPAHIWRPTRLRTMAITNPATTQWLDYIFSLKDVGEK